MESLALAVEQGADAVEFDVRGSRDGQPILLHDRTLQRFWGDPRPPHELSLAELRELPATEGGERIATLAEVARSIGIRLVVDGKDAALVAAIAEVLASADALERSCFIGEPQVLTAVREHLPTAEIILSWVGPDLPPADLLDRIRPQALNLRWDSLTEASVAAAAERGYQMWSYCLDDAEQAGLAIGWGVHGLISNDVPAVAPLVTAAVR